MSGLCAYFNKALPVMLLYNNERQQYQEAIYENTSPSSVYGAEHLLRLFGMYPLSLGTWEHFGLDFAISSLGIHTEFLLSLF